MSEEIGKKQSIGGFKVKCFNVKKGKETETFKLMLEAEVDAIKAGDCDMGKVMKALLDHQTGEVEVSLSVFIK